MRRLFLSIIILHLSFSGAQAQHTFQNTSLSKALITLDKSSKRYSISFVYDELEDFSVTKTIRRGRSLPDAVREVCGFYPIRVSTKGNEIFVECIHKDRTKLMGRLIGPDSLPVVYANITLYSLSDSILIDGGVSNEAGDFVIPCSADQARVRISCVGFKTIERQMPISNVGTIHMQMEDNHLSNVTVTGRMPVICNKADRLQYIVSNDEFARGHSVLELLSRVPMVSMAGGRAMILGKGPANFMLNGHICEMSDETIRQKLWTMRAEDIERLEVISIPTGRYQSDMGNGYINIVLQRDLVPGWQSGVSTETGINDDWSGRASGSVNYTSEIIDMTVDVNGGRTTQTTNNLTTYQFENLDDVFSDTHAKQTEKEITANLTLHYLPTKDLELGGMLSWQILWPEKLIDGEITSMGRTSPSEAGLSPNDNTTTKSITAYCDWKIDTKGKLLSFTYNNYKKDDDANSNVWFTDSYPDIIESRTWKSYACNTDYHIQSGRLDLTLPSPLATIDVGASYTSIRNQADVADHSNDLGILYEYKALDYQEKNKAAYLSVHQDWGWLTLKAGLRYEHIDWGEESRDYWLPSLSLSYKPEEGHLINLSWGTNCQRPNFYDLNPIRIYKTGFEYTEGNPSLKPSRVSNIELSYHNHGGLYACAYHHHTDNVTGNFTKATINNDHNSTAKSVNAYTVLWEMGRCNQTGLYLRYQHQLTTGLQATAEGEAFYHDFDEDNYNRELWELHGWGKRLAISADWYLNSRHTLLLNIRYQHWFSDYVGLTKTDSYGYFNFALRYSILNDQLRLSLVANDPFHQHITNETHHGCRVFGAPSRPAGEKMICFSHTNHHTHFIGITASYAIGDKKVRHFQRNKKDTESQRAQKK